MTGVNVIKCDSEMVGKEIDTHKKAHRMNCARIL